MTSEAGRRPIVTIVTPSYNQAEFLERALLSVLEQGYPDIEYIVMDGGSSDGSTDIIRRYADRLAYWASGPDGGQSAAINLGWARSTGDIVAWLNSDDYYLPGAIAAAVDAFRAHPDAPFVYGTCELVGPGGSRLGMAGRPFSLTGLRRGDQMVPQPSAFFGRRAWMRAGGLDESLHYSMDFDFLNRLAALGSPVFVNRPLSRFTIHPGAKTTQQRARARLETLEVAARYAGPGDRIVIGARTVGARVYFALPSRLRHRLDVARGLPVEP